MQSDCLGRGPFLRVILVACAVLFPLANLATAQTTSAPSAPQPVSSSSAPAAAQKHATVQPGIADNSFLMEEAYNQEYGVVQHISSFSRNWQTREWIYSFTQEWPLNPAPRHQLSYTILALHSGDFPGSGGGIGDVLLNYRYQALGDAEAKIAFSPRVSLLIPSGNSRRGRSAGGSGVQVNLPFSFRLGERLVAHSNAGTTLVPRAKDSLGNKAASYSYNLGQSFIWLMNPRLNLMLETVFNSTEVVIGANQTRRENGVTMNPGFRWAHNFSNGLQIVPGISFPVEAGPSGRGTWGILLYLSFEHPFGNKRTKTSD